MWCMLRRMAADACQGPVQAVLHAAPLRHGTQQACSVGWSLPASYDPHCMPAASVSRKSAYNVGKDTC